jgi:hypothetical protein
LSHPTGWARPRRLFPAGSERCRRFISERNKSAQKSSNRFHVSELGSPKYAALSSGSFSWEKAVNVLKTAFTGTIATGLSLVAMVIGGLIFAYGEGQSKRMLKGILFRG